MLLWISIHAAREGGDVCCYGQPVIINSFQSTPPVKAATVRLFVFERTTPISIHAAREGGDMNGTWGELWIDDFNPRRP